MKNHLAGFILSALLHAGIFSGVIILSKEQRKVAPSINNVALMVSMFQAETKPPVKNSIKPSQKLTEKKIETPVPLKVASLTLPIPEIKPKPTLEPTIKIKSKLIPAPTVEIKPDKAPSPKLVRIKPTPKSIKPKKLEKPKKIKKSTKKKTRIKKPVRRKIVKKKTVVKKRQTKKVFVKVKRHHQRAISTPVKRRAVLQKRIKKQRSYSKQQQVNLRKVSSRAKPLPRSRPQVVRRAVSQHQKIAPHHSAPTTQPVNLRNHYKARLRQLIISKKRYPKRAKKRAQQGQVKVSFNVLPNGTINNIRISKSSNSRTLDNAAIQAIKKSSGKLPFPQGMQKRMFNLSVVLSYVLR